MAIQETDTKEWFWSIGRLSEPLFREWARGEMNALRLSETTPAPGPAFNEWEVITKSWPESVVKHSARTVMSAASQREVGFL